MDVTARRKKILSDPLAAFSALYPSGSDQQRAALSRVWEQHRELEKQYKEIKERTKAISRKIGNAKHSGEPVEAFLTSMQQHSARLKAVEGQLSTTENKILTFFVSSRNHHTETRPPSTIISDRVYARPAIDAGTLSISLLQDEVSEWNSYVAGNPAASIYHRAEWRELIRTTFGHGGLYYLARDSRGNIVGILPLVRLKSRLFGDFLVSMPYFNYGGAVADHPAVEDKLVQAANEQAVALNVSHIEYRDDIPRNSLPARSDKVNMILPLPDSDTALWDSFSSKLRAQIKRPQRENPRIHFGHQSCLDDFYRVFARNMRDLGTPVYDKAFFHNILDTFPENSRIIVLYLHNRPVAGAFLMGHGDRLEIPWASTVRAVNPLSMNMLLYWEVLKFAMHSEFKYFDFGRSSRDSGTFRFKQQWGAQPKQLYWHYWLAEGSELPALNPSNRRYALLIKLWKRLPLAVTNWLGPPIVKNLP